jgi:hypothetical protein
MPKIEFIDDILPKKLPCYFRLRGRYYIVRKRALGAIGCWGVYKRGRIASGDGYTYESDVMLSQIIGLHPKKEKFAFVELEEVQEYACGPVVKKGSRK